jgi:glycerophosphoryl diester phosphodiesterase
MNMGSRFRYVFAHRGGRAHGPDNTIGTFREALARGAEGLETDAWLTADGQVILDHDGVHRAARSLRAQSATKRHQPIADVRRDELPAHMPTLAELYAECGTDFDLAIDVRIPEVADAVVEVARAADALDRLWLVGATPKLVHGWQHLDHSGYYAMSIRLVERRGDVIEAAKRSGADALNMRWPWWTKRWVRRVHDAGLLAFAYDVQSRWALNRCAHLDVDGIFRDRVDL